ncbi:ATP-binding protein [Parasphingorhabdus sp.]|uniref:ATP-binding protein n=1 Tax=Parasphingorhabdus sp. TaxID=2709688 RepID=UPI003A8FA68F
MRWPMKAFLTHQTPWMLGLSALGVASIFGALAWGGISLTSDDGGIAVVWLANAFLVAVILRSIRRNVPYYLAAGFAANIAVNVLTGDPLGQAITMSCLNQFEIILIWQLMRRLGHPRPDMQKPSELGKFCLVGGLAAPLASGFFAGMLLSSGNWESFLWSWLQWSATDGLGMLLLSPAIMVVIDLVRPTRKTSGYVQRMYLSASRIEWLVIQSFTLASAILIFGFLDFPVFFLVAPLVLLNAFRLGTPGTSVSIGLIAVVVVICAAFETGPFYSVDLPLIAKFFILQVFLLSCFAIGMPTSAMLAEMAKIRKTLRMHHEVRASMLENVSQVIFRTNENLQWQFLNPAWEKLTGRPVDDSLGEAVTETFDGGNLELLETHLAHVQSGAVKRARFEGSIHHQQGAMVDVELSFSRLVDEDGSFVGIVGSITDVTERKQIEEKLIAARDGAERAAEAKTRFLANMSHEIRTPMNGVLGFAQMLLDSDLPSEQEDHARMILDSGNAMMRLLNNILDISKVEAGQTNCTIEPMSIRHVIRSCVSLMAPLAEQKKLRLHLLIQDNIPDQILTDAGLLRQIVLNLLGNAVKFTETGAVTVTVEVDHPVDGETNLHVFVEDTGIGIPANRLEAIFAPFEQADPNTTRNFGGSGLGLTISRQLASLMGGTIDVCSTEKKGTTFHLQVAVGVPQGQLSDEPEKGQIVVEQFPETEVDKPLTQGCNGRILVAEDHDINQTLISEMIHRLGYQAVLAVNGADAVEKVEAAERAHAPFDLVLMDVQMPVMDGHEATRAIRAKGYTEERLPILAITANAYPEDIAHCLESGMQGHISKPIIVDNLNASLRDWVTPR